MAGVTVTAPNEPCYRGLRMSADEYLALGETQTRYELIDGVVCMSPSPTFRHQQVITEIAIQIGTFLRDHPVGRVAVEIDVRLRDNLVYRPDVVYLSNENAARCGDAITVPPDLVVEIISPDSRAYDARTKRADYESAGIGEYWIIDPDRDEFTFLVLRSGRFTDAAPTGDRYAASLLPNFELDLPRVRRLF